MFRDRFWITLLLSVPTLVWSDMIQAWFRFTAPVFSGSVPDRDCSSAIGADSKRRDS